MKSTAHRDDSRGQADLAAGAQTDHSSKKVESGMSLSSLPSRERPGKIITSEPSTDAMDLSTPDSKFKEVSPPAGVSANAARLLKRMGSRVEGEEQEERIDRDTLEKILEQNEEKRTSCMSVPFTVGFFFTYAMGVILHERIATIHYIEDGISEGLLSSNFDEAASKDVFDCTTAADVWMFLKDTVVSPTSSPWFQRTSRSGKKSSSESGKIEDMAFNHFHLIGGVVLEQVRFVEGPCEMEDLIPEEWSCVSTSNEMDTAPFGHDIHSDSNLTSTPAYFPGEGFKPLFAEGETSLGSGRINWDHSYRRLDDSDSPYRALRAQARGGSDGEDAEGSMARKFWAPPHQRYTFFLLENIPIADLQKRISYLHDNGWIDQKTAHVDLKASLVSLEHNLVARVNIMFHFSRKSSLDIHFRITTIPLRVYGETSYTNMVIDLIWTVLLISISVQELKEVIRSIRKRKLKEYFLDFWNCVDWATIFCGWALVAGFAHIAQQCSQMFEMMKDVPRPPAEMTEANMKKVYSLGLFIDSHANFIMYYRLLQCAYVLIIMLRFFKAFRAQPRLALVTTTIFVAGVDLAHFLIVFCSVFLTYALSGVMLFGRRLTAFSTWPKAISKSFAIACGEFAFNELATEHPVTTALWFWSFELVIYFVLLNMVMAIVLDVYAEVRSQSAHCPPLWSQMMDGARNLRNKGLHYSANRLYCEQKLVRAIPDLNEMVSAKDLKAEIPELDSDHIKSIFESAKAVDASSEDHLRLSDAMKLIGAMSRDVQRLNKNVEEMETRQSNTRKSESSTHEVLLSHVRELTELVKGMAPANQSPHLESAESAAVAELARYVEESNALHHADITALTSLHHADMAALRQELMELRSCMQVSQIAASTESTANAAVQDIDFTKAHVKTGDSSLQPAKVAEEIIQRVSSDARWAPDSGISSLVDVMRQEISGMHAQIEDLGNLISSGHSGVFGEIDKLACEMNSFFSDQSGLTHLIADRMETSQSSQIKGSASQPEATSNTPEPARNVDATSSDHRAVDPSLRSDEHTPSAGLGNPEGFSHPARTNEDRPAVSHRYSPREHKLVLVRGSTRRMHHPGPHLREHAGQYGGPAIHRSRDSRPQSSYTNYVSSTVPGQGAMMARRAQRPQPVYHVMTEEQVPHGYVVEPRPRGPHGHHRRMQRGRPRSCEPPTRYGEYFEYMPHEDLTEVLM